MCGTIFFPISRPPNYMEASFLPSLTIKSTLIHTSLFSKENKTLSLGMVHSVLMLELSFNFLWVTKFCD